MYYSREIKKSDIPEFTGLIPPGYRQWFDLPAQAGSPFAVGAFLLNKPIGIACAGPGQENKWEITWLYVLPSYRNKQVGSALFQGIADAAAGKGIRELAISYSSDNLHARHIEKALERAGFGKPEVTLHYFKCLNEDACRLRWINRYVLKEALEQSEVRFGQYVIFRWDGLTVEERAYLNEIKGGLYPDWFCPLNGEELNENSLSLGVRHNGELIGYLVTRRMGKDSLSFWRSFLKKEYRGSPLYVTMFSTVMHLQHRTGIPYTITDVNTDNHRMVRFITHGMREINYSRWDRLTAVKSLLK